MFNIILYLSRAFTVPNHIRFPISKHIAMLFMKIISIVCVNPPGKQLSQTLFDNMKHETATLYANYPKPYFKKQVQPLNLVTAEPTVITIFHQPHFVVVFWYCGFFLWISMVD